MTGIPGICMSYPFSWTLLLQLHASAGPGPPGLITVISAPGRFRLWLYAYPFCLGHQKPTDFRLGSAKIPHPRVDLINMVAPAWSEPLACTVGIFKFEGLLLSRPVLVWNGRSGVAVKKARKEWHPPKKVRCPANVESRDMRGFMQLPYPVRLHGARCLNGKLSSKHLEGKACVWAVPPLHGPAYRPVVMLDKNTLSHIIYLDYHKFVIFHS